EVHVQGHPLYNSKRSAVNATFTPSVTLALTSLPLSSIMDSMNRLSKIERARVLHLLCEGNSIRAVTRLTGTSKTTVTKLLVDAGQAASWYQDRVFRNLDCKRIQVDEIWGFVGAKQKGVATAKGDVHGDVWLWIATDADT